jgi:hypothetical protein
LFKCLDDFFNDMMHRNVDGHQHSIKAFYGCYLDLIATLPYKRVLTCHTICTRVQLRFDLNPCCCNVVVTYDSPGRFSSS